MYADKYVLRKWGWVGHPEETRGGGGGGGDTQKSHEVWSTLMQGSRNLYNEEGSWLFIHCGVDGELLEQIVVSLDFLFMPTCQYWRSEICIYISLLQSTVC